MKKKSFYIAASFLLLFFTLSCTSKRNFTSNQTGVSLTAYEQHFLDSILEYALDHEALYTLLADIKPMSSLMTFSYPIVNTDNQITKEDSLAPTVIPRLKAPASFSSNNTRKTVTFTSTVSSDYPANKFSQDTETGIASYLNELYAVQKAVNKLDLPDLKFIIIPYQSAQGNTRIIQLSVIRVSLLDSLLKAKESFFGPYGLVPGSDPAVVASSIENISTYERNRGYGYLFGYPDYAVDFFVEASYTTERTGEFQSRKFFQIPVYAGNSGYFVYAYPENYTPTVELDSALYYKANNVLTGYKEIRDQYMNADSTIRAHQLLLDLLK